MVIHEDRGSGEPLAIELAPYSLAPAGVGNGQVQGILMQVVPEHARGQMA